MVVIFEDNEPSSFNPRPVAEGRCSPIRLHCSDTPCFNPRPPLPRGDAATVESFAALTLRVSIHAPRCRGAMRLRGDERDALSRCFNPRPSLPRGDANKTPIAGAVSAVSIHAPRCRGAMLISRNCRKQGHKTAALREHPEPRAKAILHEMLDRKKRE